MLAASLVTLISARTPLGAGKVLERAAVSQSSAVSIVPRELRVLAARSDLKTGWPALAHYARSAGDREVKGLAYFVLGYREYQAADDAAAEDDLARSASTHFSLTDFAQYYRAAAAAEADQPEIAAQTLASFAGRFPRSTLRDEASRLLASSWIDSGRPQDAIPILTRALDVHKQTPLELLLAEAYQRTGKLSEAAVAFQEIYYRFPSAPQAAVAGSALKALQSSLGASYPAPSEELRWARAGGLEKVSQFSAALSEYDALLKDLPGSASVAAWRLGRDRCLLGLGRSSEALADLSSAGWPAGDPDEERNLLLVRANSRIDNQSGMLAALDHLSGAYPSSSSVAAALESVSFFFLRQGDWPGATPYFSKLADQFPGSDLAAKAEWEVAWAAYLAGQADDAKRRFEAYVERYPSSPRVGAALYWLGRLAEDQRHAAEAGAFYRLLQSKLDNNYYSLRAGERLKMLGLSAESAGQGRGSASPVDPARLSEVPPGILAAALKTPTPDPANLCPAAEPSADERSALTLADLSLPDLAEHDLRSRLEAAMGSPDEKRLRLALARLQRDRLEYDHATLNAKRALPDYSDYDLPDLPGEFWNLLYPKAFWDLVRRDAYANRLDPYLVMALIRQESGFNPKAVSARNAHGLMQLIPPTARVVAREGRGRRRVTRGNLADPSFNLRTGCRYLSEMIREFNGSIEEALAAYNAGPDRVKLWVNARSYPEPAAFVESIPFPETRGYVEVVLRDELIYRELMAGKSKFKPCRARS